MEILNPRRDCRAELVDLARAMTEPWCEVEVREEVTRGLQYYTEDGFEVLCPALGAQKQLVGGGRYEEGIGFAVGLDRLVLAAQAAPALAA